MKRRYVFIIAFALWALFAGALRLTATPPTDPAFCLSTFTTADLQPIAQNVKTTKGVVVGWYIYNNSTATRYVKFYNKASATQADTPVMRLPIPGGAAANVSYTDGLGFTTAISVRGTTGVADSDTGAPTANDVVVNVFYN